MANAYGITLDGAWTKWATAYGVSETIATALYLVSRDRKADEVVVKLTPGEMERVIDGVLQSPNGPVPVNGYWGATDVRDGGTWKADLDVYNMASPPAPQEAKK